MSEEREPYKAKTEAPITASEARIRSTIDKVYQAIAFHGLDEEEILEVINRLEKQFRGEREKEILNKIKTDERLAVSPLPPYGAVLAERITDLSVSYTTLLNKITERCVAPGGSAAELSEINDGIKHLCYLVKINKKVR